MLTVKFKEEQKMKKITSIIIMAVLIAGLAGCDKSANTSDSSTVESTSTTVESTNESAIESVPEGEPTNLILLDGKPIYTSEINPNITDPEIIERLSDDRYFVEPNAMVDSFLFFKSSTGISYNIHDNPELYVEDEEGYTHFTGEAPENPNEYQRVYVGEEICGLTLKTAEMGLVKNQTGTYSPTNRYYCEFDGTLTLTGYLYVNSPSEWYGMPGGEITLYFCEGAIPMIPSSAVENIPPEEQGFTDSIIFNHVDFIGTSETPYLSLDETIDETTVDMSGISRGDVIKVKVTVSNLKCYVSANYTTYSAHLENIEILSEVIENG